MIVKIANMEDLDQTASSDPDQTDLGLLCVSRLYLQATSVQILEHLHVPCIYRLKHTSSFVSSLVMMNLFPSPIIKTYVVGTQNNHLIEMVLFSTQNKCYNR